MSETQPYAGRPSELVGRQIASYRIEREIGRGGMAVVYQALDLRLDRTVALKLLAPELARNDTFRRRFTHESRVAAAIDHPHIVPVFEAGETDGVLYIAMRYVAGSDLRHLLDREGPLPVATATRIAAQVASALDAAHDHGLVHRDVKPGNILVAQGTDSDHPEHVYLTDFGLTKKSLSLTGFTSVGQFVGTLDYVAPEQISGKPVDGRCDVYSLACVVHETLVSRPPFQRDDDMALLWAHQYDEPPPLTGGRPDLPCGRGRGAGDGAGQVPGRPVRLLPVLRRGAQGRQRHARLLAGARADPDRRAEGVRTARSPAGTTGVGRARLHPARPVPRLTSSRSTWATFSRSSASW